MADPNRVKNLGRSIAHRRKSNGFTQAQVADRVGVEKETISRIENGSISPTIHRLLQFSDLFECTLSELCQNPDSPEEPDIASISQMMRELEPGERRLVARIAADVVRSVREFRSK